MRVLHVINQIAASGGAEVSLRDIIAASRRVVRHGVVVLKPDEDGSTGLRQVEVPCYVPPSVLGRVGHVNHVRRSIGEFQPDLVHTSLFDADLAGRIAAAIERIPVICSLVNTPYLPVVADAEVTAPSRLRFVHMIDRFLARNLTSGFHAISRATADHAVEHLGVPPAAIRVVPRGRGRERLGEPAPERRYAVRAREGWGTRPVIINVARQEPQKGQRFLLQAMPAVIAEHPDALLVVVGRRGRSSSQLDAEARDLELGRAVRWLGEREDVPDLLSAADAFAFPSLYEGLGGAAVEALGLGLPIVASDIPAMRELLGDHRGWLVPPGDPASLARNLVKVLAGGAEVESRSRLARVEFDDKYELQRCIEGMARLYEDIESQTKRSELRGRWRPPKLVLGIDE